MPSGSLVTKCMSGLRSFHSIKEDLINTSVLSIIEWCSSASLSFHPLTLAGILCELLFTFKANLVKHLSILAKVGSFTQPLVFSALVIEDDARKRNFSCCTHLICMLG